MLVGDSMPSAMPLHKKDGAGSAEVQLKGGGVAAYLADYASFARHTVLHDNEQALLLTLRKDLPATIAAGRIDGSKIAAFSAGAAFSLRSELLSETQQLAREVEQLPSTLTCSIAGSSGEGLARATELMEIHGTSVSGADLCSDLLLRIRTGSEPDIGVASAFGEALDAALRSEFCHGGQAPSAEGEPSSYSVRPLAPWIHAALQGQIRPRAKQVSQKLCAHIRDVCSSEFTRAVAQSLEENANIRGPPLAKTNVSEVLEHLRGTTRSSLQSSLGAVTNGRGHGSEARRRLGADGRFLERLWAMAQPLNDDCQRLEEEVAHARRELGGVGGEKEPSAAEAPGWAPSTSSSAPPSARQPEDDQNWVDQSLDSPFESDNSNSLYKHSIAHEIASTAVVLNCANIGCVYAESTRPPSSEQNAGAFDWEGVRRALSYYEEHGMRPQGVCKNRTAKLSPVPPDLQSRVIVCPIVDNQKDVDDLFTIRMLCLTAASSWTTTTTGIGSSRTTSAAPILM